MIIDGVNYDNVADLLIGVEPERQIGDASNGVGWIGDYGNGRLLSVDNYGNREWFNLLGRQRDTVVKVVGFGDDDDMRSIALHHGWSWGQMAAGGHHCLHYICDDCAVYVANGDETSHSLHCDCTPEEPCDTLTSRHGTFNAWDCVERETDPIRSGYYRCFGCGADEIDPHHFIIRDGVR